MGPCTTRRGLSFACTHKIDLLARVVGPVYSLLPINQFIGRREYSARRSPAPSPLVRLTVTLGCADPWRGIYIYTYILQNVLTWAQAHIYVCRRICMYILRLRPRKALTYPQLWSATHLFLLSCFPVWGASASQAAWRSPMGGTFEPMPGPKSQSIGSKRV